MEPPLVRRCETFTRHMLQIWMLQRLALHRLATLLITWSHMLAGRRERPPSSSRDLSRVGATTTLVKVQAMATGGHLQEILPTGRPMARPLQPWLRSWRCFFRVRWDERTVVSFFLGSLIGEKSKEILSTHL